MSYETLVKRTVLFLEQRANSYKQCLVGLLHRRKPAAGAADYMLADLARFCRGHGSCFGATDRDTYVLIGRKQVFDRITEHLHLTPERLLELSMGHKAPTLEEDDQ
jgi:hypothetical protein